MSSEPRVARLRGNATALAREPVDLRPARIGKPEQPRGLVECFARGVVERPPQDPHAQGAVDVHEL